MRVNCDVCGGEPAAVLCCADEAALCSACDRRVHRANKVAGKHRRIPLIGGDAAGPLCDVCKERRGLVFCVEDRAILCADCDEPIHSANDLTAKHTRFLLVGAKLSAAAIVDDDDCAQEQQESSTTLTDGGGSDTTNNNGGGAMISDYLTNICPGWQVDDLLGDDFSTTAAHKSGRRDELEHVPSMDADLFDVVAAGGKRGASSSWTGADLNKLQGHRTYWNNTVDNDSDVFAVPEINPPPAKKPRPASFWCF